MMHSISRGDLHRHIYLFGLTLLVCSLPLSRYVLSISQFLLAANWIAEGKFRKKAGIIIRDPSIIIFISIFLLYCTGFLFSENTLEGSMKIKNTLPLLLLPLVIGTSAPLSAKDVRRILMFFSAAVFTAAFICLVNYVIHGSSFGGDVRKISVFIGHGAFSLQVVMSIFFLLYPAFFSQQNGFRYEPPARLIIASLLCAFLFFLASLTGIIIFIVLSFVFILIIALKSKNRRVKNTVLLLLTGLSAAIIIICTVFLKRNFCPGKMKLSALETHTVNGNLYSHDTTTGVVENGHYIDLYVCEPELRREWNRISNIGYDSMDMYGQPVRSTLSRYLTSLGLRKDSAGLSLLDTADIRAIESGITNYKFNKNGRLFRRIYETVWEIHVFGRTGYAEHHSLGQRLMFMQAALQVFRNTWWKGTGTGDVYNVLKAKSQQENMQVDPLWEGKPHNQYIYFILAFGIFGFIWICFSLIFPVIRHGTWQNSLFNLYAMAILLSMLVFDILETYDSVVFFAFYYVLFVFGTESRQQPGSTETLNL
jgi:O-antigen ligase